MVNASRQKQICPQKCGHISAETGSEAHHAASMCSLEISSLTSVTVWRWGISAGQLYPYDSSFCELIP